MSIVNKHILKILVKNVLIVTLVLALIMALFKLIDEASDINDLNYTFGSAAIYTLFSIPDFVSKIFPVSILIGSILTSGYLNANNELTILQIGTISLKNILLILLKFGFLLSIIFFFLLETISPQISTQAEEYKNISLNGQNIINKEENIWLKDGKNIFFFEDKLPDENFKGVKIFNIEDSELNQIVLSDRGYFSSSQITLKDAKIREILRNNIFYQIKNLSSASYPIKVEFDLSKIKSEDGLKHLSIFGLIEKIMHFNGYINTKNLEVELYNRFFKIFSILPMLIIAIPLSFKISRTSDIHKKLFAGVMVAISFHMFSKIISVLSTKLNLSIFFSSSITLIFFLALGILLLKKYFRNVES